MERHIKSLSKQRIPNDLYRQNYNKVFKKCDCNGKCKPEDCKCKQQKEEDD